MDLQPIESAPIDGIPILVWCPDLSVWVAAHWHIGYVIPAIEGLRPELPTASYWCIHVAGEHPEGRELPDDPTHWMPMPPSPVA